MPFAEIKLDNNKDLQSYFSKVEQLVDLITIAERYSKEKDLALDLARSFGF